MAETVAQLQTTKRVYQHHLFHVPTTHDTILLGSKSSLLQAIPFNIRVPPSPGYITQTATKPAVAFPSLCMLSISAHAATVTTARCVRSTEKPLRQLTCSSSVQQACEEKSTAATHGEGFSLRKPRKWTQLSDNAYLALRQLLDSSPSCTVGMGALWNRHLFVDLCWPGEGQCGEVPQTSLALAEV